MINSIKLFFFIIIPVIIAIVLKIFFHIPAGNTLLAFCFGALAVYAVLDELREEKHPIEYKDIPLEKYKAKCK